MTAAAAVVTLGTFAARWHWRLDLLTHFSMQLVLALTPPCLILVITRRWRLASVAFVLLLVHASRLAPLYLPRPSVEDRGSRLRAVSANVLHTNRDSTALVELVRHDAPDFLLAMELNDSWLSRLAPIEARYPHRVVSTRPDAFGIGLFSRLPIKDYRIEWLGDVEVPSIIATLEWDVRELTVFGVHTLPPVSQQCSEQRNRQLAAAAELAERLPKPLILLGDLNTTSGSPWFVDLVRRSGLRDSRLGFGLQPSWPALPWPARIPIDHVLVSPELHIAQRSLGPPIGSDHRPVVFTVLPR
jgi:endonuclease/exonuclease/phosphatase (EEP) superfamily protein YafD